MFKILHDRSAELGSGLLHIICQNILQLRDLEFLRQFLDRDHILVHPAVKAVVRIEHIGDAAAHARREVLAGPAQDDGPPACHILKSVVAAAFRYRGRARITHEEPLARDAADVRFSGCRAVKGDVAENDILTCLKCAARIRREDQLAARQPFAESVVGIADEPDRQPLRQERAKRLPPAALRPHDESVVPQRVSEPLCDLRAEDRSESAVCRRDLQRSLIAADGDAAFFRAFHRRGFQPFSERGHEHCHVRRSLQLKVIEILGRVEAVPSAFPVALAKDRQRMVAQDQAHVNFEGPVRDELAADPQAVGPAGHLRHRAEAHLRHEFPHLFGGEQHKAGHMLRLSAEPGPQDLVLRGNTDRAGVF